MKSIMLFTLLSVFAFLSSCGRSGEKVDELRMSVTIDYCKSMKELLTEGSYWNRFDEFEFGHLFEDNGSFDSTLVGLPQDTTIVREAVLLKFNRKPGIDIHMTSKDIVEYMALHELRPGTARELLILGNTYPRLQPEKTIIALGPAATGWWSCEITGTPAGGRTRAMYAIRWTNRWSSVYWFLAFPK
jgi:hypothetical protein